MKLFKAEYVEQYTLNLWFSDGRVQSVDFKPFLQNSRHPEIRKYLNAQNFQQFSIKEGDLIWGGDFDLIFPIMDLYKNTIDRRKNIALKKTG